MRNLQFWAKSLVVGLTQMQIDQDVGKFLVTLTAQSPTYDVNLSREVLNHLAAYYRLVIRWNSRLHLVAPCDAEAFATRHVLESLLLLKYLSQTATVIDVGSGGGLPIIPCLIARRNLRATLIESSPKKSVFLREALKHTGTSKRATVVAERFENVKGLSADFVTCRALDRFVDKLPKLIDWSPRSATLLLYAGYSLRERLAELSIEFETERLPNAERRFLFIVRRH